MVARISASEIDAKLDQARALYERRKVDLARAKKLADDAASTEFQVAEAQMAEATAMTDHTGLHAPFAEAGGSQSLGVHLRPTMPSKRPRRSGRPSIGRRAVRRSRSSWARATASARARARRSSTSSTLEFELRRAGVRDKARMVFLTNEAEVGDLGVDGPQIRRGGYEVPSSSFAESMFVERRIEWITSTGSTRVRLVRDARRRAAGGCSSCAPSSSTSRGGSSGST